MDTESTEPNVILVDENDTPVGESPKLAAHEKGLCHRAFSVFILRHTKQGVELLLQQRALCKYHSPGLWTNTCCSHPTPGSTTQAAAEARLTFEMGITATLKPAGVFHYRAEFGNGLIENEVDHLFYAFSHTLSMAPNPDEVANTRWVTISSLKEEIAASPHHFTAWFSTALDITLNHIAETEK